MDTLTKEDQKGIIAQIVDERFELSINKMPLKKVYSIYFYLKEYLKLVEQI